MEEKGIKVVIDNLDERVYLSLTDDQYRLLAWLFDQSFFDAGIYGMSKIEEIEFEEI